MSWHPPSSQNKQQSTTTNVRSDASRDEAVAAEIATAIQVERDMKRFLRLYQTWERCPEFIDRKTRKMRQVRGCKWSCSRTAQSRRRCLMHQSRPWRAWRRKLLVWYARTLPVSARRTERLALEKRHPHWRDGLVFFVETCDDCRRLKQAQKPVPDKCPRCHKYESPLADLFLKEDPDPHGRRPRPRQNFRVITGSAVFKEVAEEFEKKAAAAALRRGSEYGPSHYAWTMDDPQLFKFWDDERDAGTAMHRDCELFFNSVPNIQNDSIEFKYFRRWIDDVLKGRYQVWRTEWRSVHIRRKGARWLVLFGSMDLVVRCLRTGRFLILDYKRSMAKLVSRNKWTGVIYFKPCAPPLAHINDCKEEEYSVQIGGVYKMMAELELQLGPILACYALRFHPRAPSYDVVPLHDRRKEVNLIINFILDDPQFPKPRRQHKPQHGIEARK